MVFLVIAAICASASLCFEATDDDSFLYIIVFCAFLTIVMKEVM